MNLITVFNTVVAWLDSPKSALANRAANLFTAGAVAILVCAGFYFALPLINEARGKLDHVVGELERLKIVLEKDNRRRDDELTRHAGTLDRHGIFIHGLDTRLVRVETRQERTVP